MHVCFLSFHVAEVVVAGLPCRKFFWVPDRCGHCGFQVKCIARYWELTFRNGDGLGRGAEGDL